ncbi:MAG: hypothetical protein WAM85_02205 [Terracidiphilus sp.]
MRPISGLLKREFARVLARKPLWLLLAITILCVAQTAAPEGQVGNASPMIERSPDPFGDLGATDPAMAKRQVRMLNAERQRTMVSDADKLLKLATELRAEIEVDNPTSLSPDQMRKVAEIEKLARSVRQKMSLAIGGAPVIRQTFP